MLHCSNSIISTAGAVANVERTKAGYALLVLFSVPRESNERFDIASPFIPIRGIDLLGPFGT
jgi:hypothetical protein